MSIEVRGTPFVIGSLVAVVPIFLPNIDATRAIWLHIHAEYQVIPRYQDRR